MKSAPKHPNEGERLASLDRLKILDSLPEKDFDDLTLIASQVCETPIALVSLVDETRQWFKSRQGIDAQETPREFAFCAHAILEDGLFIIPDSKLDERFKDNPLVTGNPKVIFYAGAPLLSPEGLPIGTLCVIDHRPRTLNEKQKTSLKALSNQISRLLNLRLQLEKQKQISSKLEQKSIAVENITQGVVLQDITFNIIEFNPAALEVLGLKADQLTGKTSLDPDWRSLREDGSIFPGTEHPAVVALKTGNKQKNILMGVHRPNSELRWIKINSTPIFSPNSAIASHAVTSFSDITTEKNASLLIAKNRAYLKRILDNIPAMIGHWDKDLINLNANRIYSEYFEKTPEDILGRSMRELLPAKVFGLNYPFVKKALAGETQTFESTLPLSDGTFKHALVNYLPDYHGNEVVGFFVIITDVTEIKRLENERQLMAAKMIESAKLSALGEMAGGIAHEINTPLAIITAKASLLLNGYKQGVANDAESVKQIEKIKITANRIAKIIQGLRLFSRNSKEDVAEIFSISSVIESTLDLCHEKLIQSEIKLTTDIGTDFQVSGKFAELSQVLMNLVGNSIDAVEALPEKWLHIQTSQLEKNVLIRIKDSGTGISIPIVEKMMNPFFTTKEIGKGTGLGLSISNGIVKSHRGTIWYDEQASNTCFCIELPLVMNDKKGGAL